MDTCGRNTLNPIKAAINELAEKHNPSVLEQHIYHDVNLDINELFEDGGSFDNETDLMVNIPIKTFISMTHDDLEPDCTSSGVVNLFKNIKAPTGHSWRTLFEELHCEGWDELVYDYFESPTAHELFPAPNSAEPLKVVIRGGACHCYCGVHRLVAGSVYLASKYGNNAFFKSVLVTYRPLTKEGRIQLEQGNGLAKKLPKELRRRILDDRWITDQLQALS